MTLIEVRDVAKTFSIPAVRRDTLREHTLAFFRPRRFEPLTVLDGVSFAVERGETLGIMGRNGSGKSTLLRIVSGIYPSDRGSVEVSAPLTPILDLGVGWNPELNAIDNVYLLGAVMGMSLGEIRQAMAGILAFAEIERFARLELKHFSAGMAARLAYAVAFRAVRDILVMDEIFEVGDAGFKARCAQRFEELHARGHTAILVSHAPGIISRFAGRALLLEGGRVAFEGTGAEVAQAYERLLLGGGGPEGER